MPDDALDQVLRLVAEGRLTAEEAAPILDALDDRPRGTETAPVADHTGDRPASAVRIEVSDSGRTIINLRVPLALGRAAISQVPGISEATTDRIREAIAAGIKGPIVEVDDEGDGVRISLE
jgi:SHOCT-like protein